MRGLGLLKRIVRSLGLSASGKSGPKMFDHGEAQHFEWYHNRQTILETFPKLYEDVEKNLSAGGLWHGPNDQFFGGDAELFDRLLPMCVSANASKSDRDPMVSCFRPDGLRTV